MGITYRQNNDGRLSVAQMDNNFLYIEDQLAGLTSSKTDRLVSANDLEVILDSKGTLNTPLLLPTNVWNASCDSNHMIGTYEFTADFWWEFNFKFEVSQDGIVSTMVDNPFPILTNPGYTSGNSFRFTEADHGIPDFIFDVQLNNVLLSGTAGWTANLAVTEAPEYPSTIKSLGSVKITANDKHLTFGVDGSLTFPDYSVQTTAYKRAYKVLTALLTQSGGDNSAELFYGTTTAGVSYTIIVDGPIGTTSGYDFTIIGAPNNDIGTSFIATGTTPIWETNGVVGLSYNEAAPFVTVLENTIGNVWFEFSNDGVYTMRSDGLFTNFKTVGFITYNDGGSTGLEDKPAFSIYNYDYNIYLNSALDGVLSNNVFASTSFEIRVYN